LTKPSIAPDLSGDERTFTVTHPFHPLVGREFVLVTFRHNWGEDRVYFHDDCGDLMSLPASWTSFAARDPFREIAAGRCVVRYVDLKALLELARQIKQREHGECESDSE